MAQRELKTSRTNVRSGVTSRKTHKICFNKQIDLKKKFYKDFFFRGVGLNNAKIQAKERLSHIYKKRTSKGYCIILFCLHKCVNID